MISGLFVKFFLHLVSFFSDYLHQLVRRLSKKSDVYATIFGGSAILVSNSVRLHFILEMKRCYFY